MKLVAGVDTPRGWALLGEHGLVAAGQVSGKSREAARDLTLEVMKKVTELDGELVHAAVELPYGGDHTKSVITNAVGAGIIAGSFRTAYNCTLWTPMANEWRSKLGFAGRRRDHAKRIAAKLAEAAAGEVELPAGADVREAVCIAIAAWKVRFNSGAVRRWADTGLWV